MSITEKTVLMPRVREFWEKLCGWVVPASEGGSLNIFAPLASSGKTAKLALYYTRNRHSDVPWKATWNILLYRLFSCRDGSDEEVILYDWSECQSPHWDVYWLLPAQYVSEKSRNVL